MTSLPIDAFLPEITARLGESRSLVIVAEPGAGKTTRVPPAILRANLLSDENPRLVMLQPRRVAARAAAQRIADENNWALGLEVGYHIRFEKKISPQTRLAVLTEGILTRQMLTDPYLEGVGAVILDEFHERSLNTDIAIAMLRELRQTVRDDLLLIVMSATLAAEQVATFLGDCPIVRVPGRTFPIEIEYQPHGHVHVVDRMTAAIEQHVSAHSPSPGTPGEGRGEGDFEHRTSLEKSKSPSPYPSPGVPGEGARNGDILVFLPGADEIRRVMHRLEPFATRHDILILPLHGSLPAEHQTLALRPASRRKIVLATNIAETSLTIDGVTIVIDSGLARIPQFDARRGLDRLELQHISKASATQRAGRAGRTAPGQCLRLWSAKEHQALDDFETPEVHRVDLCGAVLDLHAWGKSDPRSFAWFEMPPEAALLSAEKLLTMLGALTDKTGGEITEIGRQLMRLPAHPRLGRLLLAANQQGYSEEGATLAALLSERDIVRPDPSAPPGPRRPSTQGDSDLLLRVDLLAMAEQQRFAAHLRSSNIDPIAARQSAQARDDFLRIVRRSGDRRGHTPPDPDVLLKLLLLAYPDRVCRRRSSDGLAGAMVGGGGVRLAPESIVHRAEFFLALDARHDPRAESREAMVRIASAIQVEWLLEMFPQFITRVRSVVYDDDRQRVIGMGQTLYRDLVLSEDADAAVDPRQASEALAAALRPKAIEIFQASAGAASFLARVAILKQAMPRHPWPAFDAEELGDILTEVCQGKRSLEEIRTAPLAAALESRLVYPLDKLLREEAPETIEVPSGNRIRLIYSAGQPPILAARLQELFGWTDTPRIAGGTIPVLLHLLGPNYRPVQITGDLRSFWATTYFQVRKDLRVRYPKHSWPDDPLTARAEARGSRRRT